MSHACCDRSESRAPRPTTAPRLVDWLALAASPTFAIMALLSAIPGGDAAAMICSNEQLSPLTGMAAMYFLMSVFHAGPWLRRLRSRSRRDRAVKLRQVRPANGLTEAARSR
jgi:hypothetical protein